MTIYVDPLRNNGTSKTWRYTHNCHMFSDELDHAELLAFASRLGLKAAWLQKPGPNAHFDLTESKRKLAVKHGAVEVEDPFFWVRIVKEKRGLA